MPRILITSGPTREYLDPVRYLSNASSGRMGRALAAAAMAAGHEVLIVSGPVEVEYPDGAEVIRVVTTQEMLDACLAAFPRCDGMIGVAAHCDYRPAKVSTQKLSKTGRSLRLELVETPDIVAALAAQRDPRKTPQWIVAFALETEDGRARALKKLDEKHCDLIVLNGPEAIHGEQTEVEVLAPGGNVLASLTGAKGQVAEEVFRVIQERLIR
jgi:phosphopantothenoylcysteine decarboxylase/phosphopantothenate--cysteine ligase